LKIYVDYEISPVWDTSFQPHRNLLTMKNFRIELAKKLRQRRGNLTQKSFAKKIGIDQASVNRIDLGEQNVTIDTLQQICERLKCAASDLLDS